MNQSGCSTNSQVVWPKLVDHYTAMLDTHGTQVIAGLAKTSQPENIIRRMVEQFPATTLSAFFPRLTPDCQWIMMSVLLVHPKGHSVALSALLAQAWYRRFSALLAQRQLSPLRVHWQHLIHQFAPQLIKAFYQRHTDSQLPVVLVRELNETERLLLLSVLTPQEYPFLRAVLHAPDGWLMKHHTGEHQPVTEVKHRADIETAQRIPAPASQLRQQVWCFTLHYLLVNRGSEFNRQRYMAGLVMQMARSQNLSADALLASLISALNSTPIDSTLRRQILDLLDTIQPLITTTPVSILFEPETGHEILLTGATTRQTEDKEPRQPRSEIPADDVNPLLIALSAGEEHQLLMLWPGNDVSFAALLRWCGQLEYMRRHWCDRYSEKTLLALVNVLAPLATATVRQLIVEKYLLTTPISAATTERQLWRLTFAFLIMENPRAFTPARYLGYLLQQLAGLPPFAYEELLRDMHSHLAGNGDISLTGLSMSNVVAQLLRNCHEEVPALSFALLLQSSLSASLVRNLSFTQVGQIEAIITTLHTADLQQWQSHIAQWQRDYNRQLPLIIRDQGRSAEVVSRWIGHFDDEALLTLTTIINPHATTAMQGIITQHDTLKTVVSRASTPPNSSDTRDTLWEFSLQYLLSQRGSEFNQYQYLLSITRQLSARYHVGREIFIQQWLRLSDSGFLWRQQLIDLITDNPSAPLTAPQLMEKIQSAELPLLHSQQRSQLQHYAAVNGTALAIQLQTWQSTQLARLVGIMQPQCSEQVIALLPLLQVIVAQFRLPLYWFYSLLLSSDCPATPEQWFQRLSEQITKRHGSSAQAHYPQLQKLVLSSHAIHYPQRERQGWLSALLPAEALLTELQRWLDGNAAAPDESRLISLARNPLLQKWLYRALASPRYLQRWLEGISAETHQALLFPVITHNTRSLLALREACRQLFASHRSGDSFFWQTVYRQHWIRGINITSDTSLQQLLSELYLHWRGRQKSAHDTPLNAFRSRLLALTPPSALALRQQISQMSPRHAPTAAAREPWRAQLNDRHPDIRQSIEVIEIVSDNRQKNSEKTRKEQQDETETLSEAVTVYNAGLVIASTYIPMLFQRLALTNGQQFVDAHAQHQALFSLQWMATHTHRAPEYQLPLNKVLCGLAPVSPVPDEVALPEGAETLIDGLLTALITHWKVLRNTSVSGLQSTFIQRGGLLTSTPTHWQLTILPGTFDMLLDQLPWSFQTIKYPWMDKPLFVSWC
ncbi:MAG: hypothetical protein XXXJIFNMEKO3_02246 [Candidatus Erwinia impunctatus]|nr:hypothetical protein XXXJIFNMEKO_02246 [Culicoides impunctatus]